MRRRIKQMGILGLLLLNSVCQKMTNFSEEIENVSEEKQHYYVNASFERATNTGLELEIAYQEKLQEQEDGNHIIVVGDYGKPGDALYIGDVPRAVETLKISLKGDIIVLEYGKDFTTGSGLLDKLKGYDDINTVHSFGHGDDSQYWITLTPSDASLTVDDILALTQKERDALQESFAPQGYWKSYGCHVAADNGKTKGENFSKTFAEVTGITTIAANSWVFIEQSDSEMYMFPASRARHHEEFVDRKPKLGLIDPDPLYTGEAAWVMYTLKKK